MVPAGPRSVASRRSSFVTPPAPNASMWSRIRPRASTPSSTKGTERAPRDSASRPSAPVPANRSSTRRPANSLPRRLARMLNTASRTRSAVGRIDSSRGDSSALPRNFPAMMRIYFAARPRRAGGPPCPGRAAFRWRAGGGRASRHPRAGLAGARPGGGGESARGLWPRAVPRRRAGLLRPRGATGVARPRLVARVAAYMCEPGAAPRGGLGARPVRRDGRAYRPRHGLVGAPGAPKRPCRGRAPSSPAGAGGRGSVGPDARRPAGRRQRGGCRQSCAGGCGHAPGARPRLRRRPNGVALGARRTRLVVERASGRRAALRGGGRQAPR